MKNNEKYRAVTSLFILLPTLFFAQQFQYIVSLSPAVTEILFALGAGSKIVARTDFCNYPPEAQKIPSVGGFDGKSFSLERIAAYRPDIVFLAAGMHEYIIPALKQLQIQTHVVDVISIADILAEVKVIGKLTGFENNAEKLVTSLSEQISLHTQKNKTDEPVSIYFELWNRPYMSVGRISFISELIRIAGGKNIFDTIEIAYPTVSEEAIIANNPQIILYPSDSALEITHFKQRIFWVKMTAIINNHIYKIDADLISRPSIRMIQAIKELETIISQYKTTAIKEVVE